MQLVKLYRGQAVDVDLDAARLREGEGVVGLPPGPAPGENGVAFSKDDLAWKGCSIFQWSQMGRSLPHRWRTAGLCRGSTRL